MEIGNEISQKIRSAIKAKLIELGAYVDDELPDYIMVMVANKKTQKQMANDLNLFLSHNTDKFTVWLHSLLKKLQSINTGSEPSASKLKAKEKHKGEKRKHKTSQSERSGKTGEPEKKKTTTEKSAVKQATEADNNTDELAVAEEEKTSPGIPAAADDDTGTEINISENTDEFNEENKEIEKKSESSKSSSTGKPPPAKVTKSKKSTEEPSSSSKTSSRRHSSSKSVESTTSEKQAGSHESRRKPSSAVVAVKRRYEELDEEVEEEYDPANPAVGSVASVIRGPTRKSSVPKSLQANRSLLMKAVSDAEKSVTTAKKTDHIEKEESKMRSDRKPVDLSRRLKTAAGLKLVSRSKRKELENLTYTVSNPSAKETGKRRQGSGDGQEKMQFTVKNTSASTAKISPKQKGPAVASSRMAASAIKDISKQVQKVTPVGKEESLEGGSEEEEDDDEQYGPPLPDTRRVQRSTGNVPGIVYEEDSPEPTRSESPTDNATDPEIQRILDESHNLAAEADYFYEEEDPKRIIKSRPSPVTVDPKFIVTLDGVDPSTYSLLPDLRESIIQTVKPEVRPEPVKPERPMVAVEPEPSIPAKLAPPKIKPFNINLKDTDDEEETEEAMETETLQTKAVQERCRFWPACVNGNACQFIHPSVPCKSFPYCKFGEKCLYIHPNCRFDAKCTRHDCPFTHASKRLPNAPTVIHQVVQVPVPSYMPAAMPRPSTGNMCRFFPNCNNMNCPFIHPKPCRYGISCMNKASCMFTHPNLPDKNKLSWTAASKKENTQKPGEQSKSVETAK